MSKEQLIGAFQFTHPGQEHKKGVVLPETDFYFKNWNYNNRHSRKYVRHNVSYINAQNKLSNDKADFWCEWEPNSISKQIKTNTADKELPKFIHYPIFVGYQSTNIQTSNKIINKIITLKEREAFHKEHLQNTDPFIFGDNFYYTCCKQEQTKNLGRGSVILFGSTFRNPNKYVIDTIFVVDKIVDCNETLAQSYTGIFYDAVLHKIYHGHSTGPRLTKNKIFIGATYENPINGMYSFFPCTPSNNNTAAKRLEINQMLHPKVSSNLQSRGIYLTTAENETISLWNSLKEYTLNQGYCLGVKADMPPILTPSEIPTYISNLD